MGIFQEIAVWALVFCAAQLTKVVFELQTA